MPLFFVRVLFTSCCMSHVYLQNHNYVFDERLAGAIQLGCLVGCPLRAEQCEGLTSSMAGGWWKAGLNNVEDVLIFAVRITREWHIEV